MQAELIPQPLPQICPSHAQRWNTDQLADGIHRRHEGFAGEDHSAGETRTLSRRHFGQELLEVRVQLVDADHQQRVVFNGIQESGNLGSEIGRLQSHQQLSTPAGAEVNQRREVVFPQARFTADHQCLALWIL